MALDAILNKLHITNLQILSKRRPPGNIIADYLQKSKLKGKKERKTIKPFLQAFSGDFREFSLNCLIYRTLTDHIQINYVLLQI